MEVVGCRPLRNQVLVSEAGVFDEIWVLFLYGQLGEVVIESREFRRPNYLRTSTLPGAVLGTN